MARITTPAGRTGLAWGPIGKDYGVTNFKMRHALADLLNDSRAFMAEDNRERHAATIEVLHGEIRVADPARDNPDKNLIWSGWIDDDVANDRWFTRSFEQ